MFHTSFLIEKQDFFFPSSQLQIVFNYTIKILCGYLDVQCTVSSTLRLSL